LWLGERPKRPLLDPILARWRAARAELNGNSLERAVCFGLARRQRGTASSNPVRSSDESSTNPEQIITDGA
jgi:hypothetical protein